MELYLQLTNIHDVELVILSELAPTPICGKGVAVKPGKRLKSGIACFESAKERLKRSVHLAQDSLATHVIYEVEVPSSPNVPKLVLLLVVRDGRIAHLPRISSFLERRVI